ncbi:MAG TPA: glycosyltransferase family 39 protein [Streptosporangiaceae bacterium]|nr:glycosyltransferase family 39 protein [Streptosporangiaceae bacterium]
MPGQKERLVLENAGGTGDCGATEHDSDIERLVQLTQATSATRQQTRRTGFALTSKYQLLRSRWLLPVILLVQALLSVRLFWSNTAFQDESLYLWAGHLELAHLIHGSAVPPVQTYFSGAPAIYPPLAALADSVGGLPGARLLSLAFMITTTVLLYLTAKRLFSRGPALAAAALFAAFGMTDQLGAFATYDAMALCLLALSAWLVVMARGRLTEPLLIAAAASLALADATKYATVLWNPVVIALAVLAIPAEPGLKRCLNGVRLASYTLLLDAVAIHEGGRSYLRGLEFTTFNRQIVTGTSPLKIFDIAWGWLALLLLLGFLGLLLLWLDNRRPNLLPVVLFAALLLAPTEQARISDITSLHKHVVFGAWFTCILAGYAITRISQLDGQLSHGVIIGSVLIAVVAVTGFSQATSVTRSWPSVSHAMPALSRAIDRDGCPCLVMQETAAYYYLPAKNLTGPVIGPYTFSYRSAASWQPLSGTPGMVAAIRNGYFGVVEVDASRGRSTYRVLVAALRNSRQYRLVRKQPWSLHPKEPTEVWERLAGSPR